MPERHHRKPPAPYRVVNEQTGESFEMGQAQRAAVEAMLHVYWRGKEGAAEKSRRLPEPRRTAPPEE